MHDPSGTVNTSGSARRPGYDQQLRGVAASARARRAEKIARLIATAPALTTGQVQRLTLLLHDHPRANLPATSA